MMRDFHRVRNIGRISNININIKLKCFCLLFATLELNNHLLFLINKKINYSLRNELMQKVLSLKRGKITLKS